MKNKWYIYFTKLKDISVKENLFQSGLESKFFQPQHKGTGEMTRHLRRDLSDVLESILTIRAYNGYLFLINDIGTLERVYACVHCCARLT